MLVQLMTKLNRDGAVHTVDLAPWSFDDECCAAIGRVGDAANSRSLRNAASSGGSAEPLVVDLAHCDSHGVGLSPSVAARVMAYEGHCLMELRRNTQAGGIVARYFGLDKEKKRGCRTFVA